MNTTSTWSAALIKRKILFVGTCEMLVVTILISTHPPVAQVVLVLHVAIVGEEEVDPCNNKLPIKIKSVMMITLLRTMISMLIIKMVLLMSTNGHLVCRHAVQTLDPCCSVLLLPGGSPA